MAQCQSCDVRPIGIAECIHTFKRTSNIAFASTFVDGVEFGIPLTEFNSEGRLPVDYIANQLDSLNWDITPIPFFATTPSRTSDVIQTNPNGEEETLFDGVIKFEGELTNLPPALGALIESRRCQDTAVIIEDIEGNWLMELSRDGQSLLPLKTTRQSLRSKLHLADDGKSSYHTLMFTLSTLINERRLVSVSFSNFDVRLANSRSLVDLQLFQTMPNVNTATSIFVDVNSDVHGDGVNPFRPVGLDDVAKWSVTLTNGVAVTVTGVIEVSDGMYEIQIDSTPSTDVVVRYNENRIDPTSFGYFTTDTTFTTGA